MPSGPKCYRDVAESDTERKFGKSIYEINILQLLHRGAYFAFAICIKFSIISYDFGIQSLGKAQSETTKMNAFCAFAHVGGRYVFIVIATLGSMFFVLIWGDVGLERVWGQICTIFWHSFDNPY